MSVLLAERGDVIAPSRERGLKRHRVGFGTGER